MRISFLVPVFNERATILEVLERIEALQLDSQLIVVDDGSTDGTTEVLQTWHEDHPDAVVLHQANRGKGSAIRAAIPHIDSRSQ